MCIRVWLYVGVFRANGHLELTSWLEAVSNKKSLFSGSGGSEVHCFPDIKTHVSTLFISIHLFQLHQWTIPAPQLNSFIDIKSIHPFLLLQWAPILILSPQINSFIDITQLCVFILYSCSAWSMLLADPSKTGGLRATSSKAPLAAMESGTSSYMPAGRMMRSPSAPSTKAPTLPAGWIEQVRVDILIISKTLQKHLN